MLTEQIVLTAAHCLNETGHDDGYIVRYGMTDLQSSDDVERRSSYVYRNPGYGADAGGDCGLIKLANPITGAKLLPIATNDSYDTGTFTVAGWGAMSEGGAHSRYLLKAEVPFVDDTKCEEAYPYLKADVSICAGYDKGGTDTCQGDSGGPMFRRDSSNDWIQVGIVSGGYGCARAGYPGVYAQARAMAADILKAAGSLP